MTIEGEALLVRIYIGESDTRDGRPLYDAIVRHLRERGIRGVSVFRGIEGYGRSSRVHTTRILALSEDLPILVEAVDAADRIRGDPAGAGADDRRRPRDPRAPGGGRLPVRARVIPRSSRPFDAAVLGCRRRLGRGHGGGRGRRRATGSWPRTARSTLPCPGRR